MIRLWCRLFGHRWYPIWRGENAYVCSTCKLITVAVP